MSLLKDVIGYGLRADRPAAGSQGRLYYETDTNTIFRDNGTTWDALTLAGGSTFTPYVLLQEQQATGTNGGTFTSGAWQTRELNTVVSDTDSNLVSLSSGVFVLTAGTYRLRATAPGHMVNRHQARLQNVTAGTTLLMGTSCRALQGEGAQTDSVVVGRFTVAAAQSLELQHQGSLTEAADGFGNAATFDAEVYAQVELWKE